MIGTVVAFFYDQAQIGAQNICSNYAVFVIISGMARVVALLPIVVVVSPTVNFVVPIALFADFFIFGGVGVIRVFFVIFLFICFDTFFFGNRFGTLIDNVLFVKTEFQLINSARIDLKIFRKIDGVGFPAAIAG